MERGGLWRRIISDIKADPRWAMDEPPLLACVEKSFDLSWTRDVFDRLLVAHARHRKWRLATGDGEIIDRLGSQVLEL